MSDRNEEKDGYGVSSTRGGAPRRGGFGDDQGTRVGRPSENDRSEPAPSERAENEARPSSRPVKEGLEGAILDDGEKRRQ